MSKHVIVDLEMCEVTRHQRTKEFRLGNEIIQIGAVILDENNEEIDSFSTFVKPQYGRLNNFIHNLTGISEYDLCDAPLLEDALGAFMAWIPDDCVAVSWSHSDDCQIRRETEAKGIVIPGLAELLETWEDCQETFTEKIDGIRLYNLTEALNLADIYYEDGAHDGLVDAHNTALLYAKMQREEVMSFSKYYVKDDPKDQEIQIFNDWAKLFAGIVLPDAAEVAVAV